MKKIFITLAAAAMGAAVLHASQPGYGLAERFSAKKVSQMVHSTRVSPNWFLNSDRFWYSWTDPDGTQYYIVDAKSGKKTPVFDMDRLAMEITGIVKDPFDAQHLPIRNIELKDDKTFVFEIKSTLPEKDSARIDRWGDKKVFTFSYDIASKKLTDITGKEGKNKLCAWENAPFCRHHIRAQ